MKEQQKTEQLMRAADENGIIQTIIRTYGTRVSVNLPFDEQACAMSIDVLDLSVRASNALKRAGLLTISEVIEAIHSNRLGSIRNLGRKTENEIKTRLLLFGYNRLPENTRFLHDPALCGFLTRVQSRQSRRRW